MVDHRQTIVYDHCFSSFFYFLTNNRMALSREPRWEPSQVSEVVGGRLGSHPSVKEGAAWSSSGNILGHFINRDARYTDDSPCVGGGTFK